MTKPSIFEKFKMQPHWLELEKEWLIFSVETEEQPLLEQILTEKEDGTICLVLNKRYGIHPSENNNESVKPTWDDLIEKEKKYFLRLDEVSNETGLSKTEIVYYEKEESRQEYLELLEKLSKIGEKIEEVKGKEKEQLLLDVENIKTDLIALQEKIKKETKEIKDTIDFEIKKEIEDLSNKYLEAYKEYHLALISHFLSGKRILTGSEKQLDKVEVNFSVTNVKNLHPDFIELLINFIQNEKERWENSNKKHSEMGKK